MTTNEPERDQFEEWADQLKDRSKLQMLWDRCVYWWQDLPWKARELRNGVRSLQYWLPVVWRDRNWDHSFIYRVLQHKLRAQADYIAVRGNHLNAPTDARLMRTCVALIDRLDDDFYAMEYTQYCKNKHWFEDVEDHPGSKSWHSRLIEDRLDEYFAKYPKIYQRVLGGEGLFQHDGDRERIAMSMAQLNHNRARKLLFKIMENNIERWWN
jgi:hypothetical protein